MEFFLILLIDIAASTLWISVLRKQDRTEKYKRRVHWIILFFIGGIASAFLSFLVYDFNAFGNYLTAGGSDENPFLLHFYLVGPSEELAKLIVFIVLSSIFRTVREPLDAAMQSATVGLGFAILENLGYGLEHGTIVILVRSIICILDHMTYTAVSGFAFGMTTYWYSLRKQKAWFFIPFIGLMFASIFHGLSNFLLSIDQSVLSLVIGAGLWVVLFRGFAHSSRISPYRLFPLSEWDSALEYIDYGLRRDPDNPILNLRKGVYEAYSGAWPNAILYFEKAEKLKPGSALYHAYAEAARIELGRKGSAESLARYFSMLPEKARKAFLSTMKSLSARFGRDLKYAIEALTSPPHPTSKRDERVVREDVSPYYVAPRNALPADAPRKPRGI